MSLPVVAEPLPSSYMFGKVVGRVIHLIADNAADTDDKPQARAAAGKVTFAPKEAIRKTIDADYPAIVLHAAETANLSDEGRVLDGEGRQGIWLAAGIYTVTFSITGAGGRTIPSFDIEVTTAHTDASPLDLARYVPYVPPTGTVVQTLVVPAGGAEGQVLVRTADGSLAWADAPKGTGGGGDGTPGEDGASAYEVAVANGYVGTEADWLLTLVGPQGDPGEPGADGQDGADGASAYDIARDHGYGGTETQWLATLKGDKGDPGTTTWAGITDKPTIPDSPDDIGAQPAGDYASAASSLTKVTTVDGVYPAARPVGAGWVYFANKDVAPPAWATERDWWANA